MKRIFGKEIIQRCMMLQIADIGNIEIVNVLLGIQEVDVNVKDVNGKTPLDLARDNKHDIIVEFLLKKYHFFNEKRDTSSFYPKDNSEVYSPVLITNGRFISP